jgi:hypothetical protein
MSIKDVIGIHQDNPMWDEVQKWMEQERQQERLKYILSEIVKINAGLYSANDLKIQDEIRELLDIQKKPSKLRFVGLIGHIGAGKDHVANYIAQNVERKCAVVKFATKLVEVTASILGVDDLSLFQDRAWKEKKQFVWQCSLDNSNASERLISAREALCTVGSLMRSVDHQIWVRGLKYSCNQPDTLYIISDLRYQNELNFVQQNNGIVIYIENLQAAQAQHRRECGKPHSSEELVWRMHYRDIQPDYVLNNNNHSDPQPLQDLLTFLSTVS